MSMKNSRMGEAAARSRDFGKGSGCRPHPRPGEDGFRAAGPRQAGWSFAAAALLIAAGCGREEAAAPDTAQRRDASPLPSHLDIPGLDRIGQVESANPMAAFLPLIIPDEFNTEVTDAERANPQPRRGGRLRLRTPSDFRTLNTVLSTTQPERMVLIHMTDSLVNRDRGTLEFYPEIAWSWWEADLIKFPGEEPVHGRILEKTGENALFAPGAWHRSFGKFDVAEYNDEEGYLVLSNERGGERIEGAIAVFDHTITVDEGMASGRETITVTLAELDTYDTVLGGETRTRPFLKESCLWQFHVRDGVTWHDGHPFTAEDVKFGHEMIMNPYAEAAHRRVYHEPIESIDIIDAGNTIQFTIKRPYYNILTVIAGTTGDNYFLPRHIFQPERFGGDEQALGEAFNRHSFNDAPVYTGPYRFKEYRRGNVLTIQRNENYWKNLLPEGAVPRWNPEQPYLDEVSWVYYTESAAVVRDMMAGRLDAEDNVEPTVWNQPDTNSAEFRRRMVRAEGLAFAYTYIGWNMDNPLFRDETVRRALAMLIPREEIAQSVHMGAAFPVSGPFFIMSPSYDHDVEPIPYDPEGARRLLMRAGWLDRSGDGILEKEIDGRMVPFRFSYSIHNARDYHQKIADIIKEHVEQAGISMTINRSDWTIFTEEIRQRNFDAVRFAWSTIMDPDPFQIWHSSQIEDRGDNFIGYRNARVDEICELIREEMDPLKRWELGREMHRIVAQEQPQCFLFAFKEFLFYNRNLRGVKIYANEYPYNYTEWWWKE